MLKELQEETRIKVPEAVLRGSIKSHREFDNPTRSLRGRVITHAYHIALDEKTLPKVKGGSDALSAVWLPLGQIKRDQMFEDHFDIIETMVGV
jgi:bifunctional NMN adenylyltransferase/nudix hydrolase